MRLFKKRKKCMFILVGVLEYAYLWINLLFINNNKATNEKRSMIDLTIKK